MLEALRIRVRNHGVGIHAGEFGQSLQIDIKDLGEALRRSERTRLAWMKRVSKGPIAITIVVWHPFPNR